MRRRFFVEQFDGGTATLRGDTARHLSAVLRATPGQQYELSDGAQVWLGEIRETSRDSVKFSLVEQMPARESKLRVELLLAIVKFDRFEWAIEKATELGVSAIVPVAAARSEKGLLAATAKRAGRWKRILTESAQQARRLRIPVLGELAKPQDAFRAVNAHIRLLLSERDDASAMRDLLEPALL